VVDFDIDGLHAHNKLLGWYGSESKGRRGGDPESIGLMRLRIMEPKG
jgi:hypothetical protein